MCDCPALSEPPPFNLPPPPDPSLVWHLLTDQPFQQVKIIAFTSENYTHFFCSFSFLLRIGKFDERLKWTICREVRNEFLLLEKLKGGVFQLADSRGNSLCEALLQCADANEL